MIISTKGELNMSNRIFICIFITVTTLFANVISVSAEGFDATYYANKYPDVVQQLGNDPAALEQHYLTFGVNEGRFQNQQEEIDNYNNLLNNPGAAPDNTEVVAAPVAQPLPGAGTYIDVNIAEQTVNYFENGVVKLSTPCVTGNVNAGNGTPTGTFAINTLTPGKFLTGPTWNVWVDRWMRFTPNAAIGLHDASWRSNFGGDIYLTSGSHGCVNLPHDAAVQLFDMASIGTTVIVH